MNELTLVLVTKIDRNAGENVQNTDGKFSIFSGKLAETAEIIAAAREKEQETTLAGRTAVPVAGAVS